MRNEFLEMIDEFNKMLNNNTYQNFAVNVLEGTEGYNVIAALPGVKKEDINVMFDDGILTIKAKRDVEENKYLLKEFGSTELKRSINLGDIDVESTSASFDNGLLSIKLNLKKPEVKEKKNITIE